MRSHWWLCWRPGLGLMIQIWLLLKQLGVLFVGVFIMSCTKGMNEIRKGMTALFLDIQSRFLMPGQKALQRRRDFKLKRGPLIQFLDGESMVRAQWRRHQVRGCKATSDAVAGDLGYVQGKDTFFFGKRSPSMPVAAREHLHLKCDGFETTATSSPHSSFRSQHLVLDSQQEGQGGGRALRLDGANAVLLSVLFATGPPSTPGQAVRNSHMSHYPCEA